MGVSSEVLIDAFLTPVEPASPYTPSDGTVAYRVATHGNTVLEVYRRANQSLGFRYSVWVAWRDAGGEVRSHSWWQFEPDKGLITDDYHTACECAERHAESKGVAIQTLWVVV